MVLLGDHAHGLGGVLVILVLAGLLAKEGRSLLEDTCNLDAVFLGELFVIISEGDFSLAGSLTVPLAVLRNRTWSYACASRTPSPRPKSRGTPE